MKTPFYKRSFLHLMALGLALTMLGCAAIRSTKHTGSNTDSGLAYYLPKGMLKLLVVREVTTPPTPNQITTTNQVVFTNIVASAGVTNRTPIATNQVAFTNATLAVTNLIPTTNCFVTADVEISPDRDAMYILKMKPSAMADDYMRLGVTNGLLQTVTLTNGDQTLGVLNNLVLAAIEAYKFVATGGFGAAGAETVRTTNLFLIDPFNLQARTDLVNYLGTNFGVTLDFSDFPASKCMTTNAIATDGVFYRPLQAYRFAWNSSSGSGAGSLYLPDASPTLSMDVKRATFVSQAYMLSFQQGIPVEVVLNKPSQGLALSTFPLTVARALVSLPTNLIQLKIDYSSKSSDLLKAQSAQITNLINELEAEKKFNAWQATNKPAVSGGGGQSGVGGRPN